MSNVMHIEQSMHCSFSKCDNLTANCPFNECYYPVFQHGALIASVICSEKAKCLVKAKSQCFELNTNEDMLTC